MSEPRRITSEDLALYAMQLLSKEETAEVTAYLQESAEARRELAEIQGDDLCALVDLLCRLRRHANGVTGGTERRRFRLIDRQRRRLVRKHRNRSPDWFGLCRGGCAYRRVGKRRPIEQAQAGQHDYLAEDEQPNVALWVVLPWIGWAAAAGQR
jgi:hypothetical protein